MTYSLKTLQGTGPTSTIRCFKNFKLVSLLRQTKLTITNTKHFFSVIGANLFQLNEDNKSKVVSYNIGITNLQEQKFATLHRELLGILHAVQLNEILVIGSSHPIHICKDHKPLLHCFTKKLKSAHVLFKLRSKIQ